MSNADLFIGRTDAARKSPAWKQTYRALNHGFAKGACTNKAIINKFPVAIQDFATAFCKMQVKRHQADYDPIVSPQVSEVLRDISETEIVIRKFNGAKAIHKREFAAHVLFQNRKD